MNIEKLRELVNADSDSPRVAELAALFVQRSAVLRSEPGQRYGAAVEAGKITQEFALTPALAARLAEKLVQCGENLHSFAVIDCNRGLTPAQEHNRERNAEMAREIGEALGFRVETGGDPRGCVLKLYDPKDERAGDGWGGGWGVYRG